MTNYSNPAESNNGKKISGGTFSKGKDQFKIKGQNEPKPVTPKEAIRGKNVKIILPDEHQRIIEEGKIKRNIKGSSFVEKMKAAKEAKRLKKINEQYEADKKQRDEDNAKV